jgi:hypothetical protein
LYVSLCDFDDSSREQKRVDPSSPRDGDRLMRHTLDMSGLTFHTD